MSMRGATHPGPENTYFLATQCCRCDEKGTEGKSRKKRREERVVVSGQRQTPQPVLSAAAPDDDDVRLNEGEKMLFKVVWVLRLMQRGVDKA